MMKKFKAMLIACLCAVTTFVTLGAVKSTTTARADDTTTDYIYRDTTVAAVSVNADLPTYPRLELTGTDFKDSTGTYSKGKDYTNVSSLNTFTKIKIDGTAVGSVWDGNITDPYLNMFDNSVDRFAFKFENFPTATEVVIEEGCEFPSYALWSGTGDKIVYKTTETATFKKVDGAWVKQVSDTFEYVDTSVTSLTTVDGWDEMGFMWFNLSVCDYTGASNFDKKKDYTYINALNTLSHIKIGETTIGGQWDKDANDPYINLFAENAFTFKAAGFVSATEITVEAGCEFPSYARWNAGSNVVYRTTETVTFRKVNGAWYKVYTATFVDEAGNELGKATFTTADADLTYPTYEADPAYDYVWTNNEIKAENITVTLTKTIKTFDVIIGEAAAVKYNYGTKITAPEDPTKTKDGYTVTFDGWYNGETKWNFETDTVTSNVTLVAKFNETINTYSAKLVLCDGTEKDVSYTIENRAEKLAEAKTFLGANDAQYTYTNDLPTELPLENGRTYTETRTVNEYDVKIGESATVKVAYGNKLTKPESDPTKDMTVDKVYTFDGWYNGETKWNFDTDTVKGDVTLVAKFTETARKYTVTITFVGLEKDEVTLQVEYNGRVDFSAYAEDGYNMTIKNGETEINGLTVTGDANITVTYAKKPAAAKKGCGGSVNGVMPVLAILCLAGAVVVTKKKRV